MNCILVKRTMATWGPTLKIYPGAPHGMCTTLKDQVNADLLAFFKG
jgi:non-heme chloroperoxidase